MTSTEKQLLKQNTRAAHTKCRFLAFLELIHLGIPQFTPFSPACLSVFGSNFSSLPTCLTSAFVENQTLVRWKSEDNRAVRFVPLRMIFWWFFTFCQLGALLSEVYTAQMRAPQWKACLTSVETKENLTVAEYSLIQALLWWYFCSGQNELCLAHPSLGWMGASESCGCL